MSALKKPPGMYLIIQRCGGKYSARTQINLNEILSIVSDKARLLLDNVDQWVKNCSGWRAIYTHLMLLA